MLVVRHPRRALACSASTAVTAAAALSRRLAGDAEALMKHADAEKYQQLAQADAALYRQLKEAEVRHWQRRLQPLQPQCTAGASFAEKC